MPFTVQELENAANAAIDYHYNTPKVLMQTLQNKPLLKALRGNVKTFPGGKDRITGRVQGEFTTTIQGFEHDDTVVYQNPANIKEWSVPYKLIHGGISFTKHEMVKGGITIVDDIDSASRKSGSEVQRLADLLQNKTKDMQEGIDRGFNVMYWRDGTQDAKLVPGVTHFVHDDPTAAVVVAGIDQASNTWWRNHSSGAIALGDTTGDSQAVVNKMRVIDRQQRKNGGNPNLYLAGADFLDRLELELKAKGHYTDSGWAGSGNMDVSVADVSWKGKKIVYDPTLDDLGKSKYLYALDTSKLFPMVADGEDMQKHKPSRPENKYVFYRATTWVGALVCEQRNAQAVFWFN